MRHQYAGAVESSAQQDPGRSTSAAKRPAREPEPDLRERHRILPGLDNDFTIRNLTLLTSAGHSGTKSVFRCSGGDVERGFTPISPHAVDYT
jgi:hypothetical protein